MSIASRQNNFNLMRLIFALLVLLSHSAGLVDGTYIREPLTRVFGTVSLGHIAVDGFFLLSGYLIMQSWVQQPRAWQFFKKRVLRIYPGFIIASLVCALIVGPLGAAPAEYFSAFDAPAFINGVLLLAPPVVPPVFQGQPLASVNGSMWSISREFVCYLIVLFTGVAGASRVKHFWAGLTITVFAVIILLKLAKQPIGDLRVLSFFLVGICYYIYREHIVLSGRTALLAVVISLLAMYSWRAAELVLALIGSYAFLYAANKRSALLSRFNGLPDVSYGVYLYGWPIQKLVLWYFPGNSPWALFAISAPLAILAGTVSWYLIEKPALRLKGTSLRPSEVRQETIIS